MTGPNPPANPPDSTAARTWPRRLVVWGLIPALLGGLIFAENRLFRLATCETYDEYTYLIMGMAVYRNGDFQSLASPMTPPLPILLNYWLPALRAEHTPLTPEWDRAVPELTRQARFLASLLTGVPVVLLVSTWITRRRGWLAGALAGGLVALSPTIVAATSIAATDGPFALGGVVAAVGLARFAARPSRWSYLGAAGAVGFGLACKQSAAIFFPLALVELLLQGPPARRDGWTGVDVALRWGWRVATRFVGLVALAFVVDWAFYGLHTARYGATGTSTTLPVVVPMVAGLLPHSAAITEFVSDLGMPLAIDTFVGQMNHAALGHPAFLMGMHSTNGWWYFFPVALAIKSTPAELALMALALALACRAATWRDPTRRTWLGASLVMLAAGVVSKINIGQRYMILVYPLVILLGADWLGSIAGRRRRWALAVGGLLIAGQAVSAGGIAPHYLAYFNSFCGGPMEGHRYLVDSSLDWGQDLPTLRRELEARHYHQVALNYFGTAQADVYGLRVVEWQTRDEAVAASTDYLAISATSMMGAYGPASLLYNRFKDLPSARVGYSIFLYDLSDPRVRSAWDAVRRN